MIVENAHLIKESLRFELENKYFELEDSTYENIISNTLHAFEDNIRKALIAKAKTLLTQLKNN